MDIPDAVSMAALVVGLSSLLGLYLKVRQFEGGLRGEAAPRQIGPLPLPIEAAPQWVPRHEHEALSRRVDQISADIRADVQRLHDRIDAVPGRVVALLAETKNLHQD